MHFKLIVGFVDDDKTDAVLDAAREHGATGATVITNARGEGIDPHRTFLGLELATQRDVVLMLVEESLSRRILEEIARVGEFETASGKGIAMLIDVEDAVGVGHQVAELKHVVEENL